MLKPNYDVILINGNTIDLRTASQEVLKKVLAVAPHAVSEESKKPKKNASTTTEPSESDGVHDAE